MRILLLLPICLSHVDYWIHFIKWNTIKSRLLIFLSRAHFLLSYSFHQKCVCAFWLRITLMVINSCITLLEYSILFLLLKERIVFVCHYICAWNFTFSSNNISKIIVTFDESNLRPNNTQKTSNVLLFNLI